MRGDVLAVNPLLELVVGDGFTVFQCPALLGNLSRGDAFDAVHVRDDLRSVSEWGLGCLFFHDP